MSIYLALAILTLSGLLYATRAGQRRLVYVFKPATSLLCVWVAWNGHGAGAYGAWITTGLLASLVGDVALLQPGQRWFLGSLVAFLIGHVAYILAFNQLTALTVLNWPAVLALLSFSAGILAWLWPRLGAMRLPVVVYVIAITLMVWSAWAAAAQARLALSVSLSIGVGATCFYISDVSVAIDTFVEQRWANKAWGLPLYYLGQFSLAWSVAALGAGKL
jgi:uncharacterized membrane protein YhhN